MDRLSAQWPPNLYDRILMQNIALMHIFFHESKEIIHHSAICQISDAKVINALKRYDMPNFLDWSSQYFLISNNLSKITKISPNFLNPTGKLYLGQLRNIHNI